MIQIMKLNLSRKKSKTRSGAPSAFWLRDSAPARANLHFLSRFSPNKDERWLRYLGLTIILLSLTLTACGGATQDVTPTPQSTPTPKAETMAATATLAPDKFAVTGLTEEEVAIFVQWLKSAVAASDGEEIASRINFPIAVYLDGKRTQLDSAQQVIENYPQIIDDTVRQAVQAQEMADLFSNSEGVMIGNGEIWFASYCADKGDDNFTDCQIMISAINNAAPVNGEATPNPPVASGFAALVGQWVVSNYEFASISAMQPDEAETWLGEVAIITPDSISFRDHVCNDATFESRVVNAAEHFYEGYRTDPVGIGIEQPYVELIESDCQPSPFSTFEVNENNIIFSRDGIFFFLEKVQIE